MFVRGLLGIKPRSDVEPLPSPAEALPIDPMGDLELTKQILKHLQLTASRSTRPTPRP